MLKKTVSRMQKDLAKVNTNDGTLTTEVCQLKDDSATIAADVKHLQKDTGKLAAAITTLRSQQIIEQQKPPVPPLRKRNEGSKAPAALLGKSKKAAATEQEGSYDATYEPPTEERQRACVKIFQLNANVKVYLCNCGAEYDFKIAGLGKAGSAGKAYATGRGGPGGLACSCYKELISEKNLVDMYSALSGGKLAVATKKIGDDRRDPAIPRDWADAMFELVSAEDSTGTPIFNPTQEFIAEPSRQKKKLSFSPARGKKRDADRTKLAFSPEKQKKQKKQKKHKKHDKVKSKHKKSKKVRA